jgi:hypothetical protein
MRSDDPTVPSLYAPDTVTETAAASEQPTWPSEGARVLREQAGGLKTRLLVNPHVGRPPHGYAGALVLGFSLGANVGLLLALLGILLLGHPGMRAVGGSSSTPSPGAALRSPIATATPRPSSGWLRVAPSSVQLSCSDGQQTEWVVLQNTATQRVEWQVIGAGDQAGIAVNPDHGQLSAGASQPLQVQTTSHTSDTQSGAGQQGLIRFTATPAEAGPSPSLSYTTTGCQ